MPPLNFHKLQDKHVLIIGGSSGIGLAVAEGALASGARVTISSSSPANIARAISALESSYPNHSIAGIPANLGEPSSLESDLESLFASAAAGAADGTIDHVVFTAADRPSLGGLDTVTVDLIHRAAHMRMVLPVMLAKVAARYLPKSRKSSLTLTSGCVADKPTPGWAVVGFFGGGLVSLGKALAVDLAPVRVNVVQCGYTDTPLWGADEERKRTMMDSLEAKLLTGKFGEVEDVAEAYLWVLKDGNVTGTAAKTDGGFLLT